MNDTVLIDNLILAKNGNTTAQENLLKHCKSFILRTSSEICKRKLAWENDDELSIALLAFDEAVKSYDPERGANFYSFARRVIHQRLIDYFRSEQKHQHLSLNGSIDDNQQFNQIEAAQSLDEFNRGKEQEELAEIMLEFDRTLKEYNVSLEELAEVCPKHRDTREKLLGVAKILCNDPNLMGSFQNKKRLPAGSLASSANVSTKVLDKGRKYVIALALIISDHRFSVIKSFIDLE